MIDPVSQSSELSAQARSGPSFHSNHGFDLQYTTCQAPDQHDHSVLTFRIPFQLHTFKSRSPVPFAQNLLKQTYARSTSRKFIQLQVSSSNLPSPYGLDMQYAPCQAPEQYESAPRKQIPGFKFSAPSCIQNFQRY